MRSFLSGRNGTLDIYGMLVVEPCCSALFSKRCVLLVPKNKNFFLSFSSLCVISVSSLAQPHRKAESTWSWECWGVEGPFCYTVQHLPTPELVLGKYLSRRTPPQPPWERQETDPDFPPGNASSSFSLKIFPPASPP